MANSRDRRKFKRFLKRMGFVDLLRKQEPREPMTLLEHALSWHVVEFIIAAIPLAIAAHAMFSGRPIVAYVALVLCAILFLARFLTWQFPKTNPAKVTAKVVVVTITCVVTLALCGFTYWLNPPPPQELPPVTLTLTQGNMISVQTTSERVFCLGSKLEYYPELGEGFNAKYPLSRLHFSIRLRDQVKDFRLDVGAHALSSVVRDPKLGGCVFSAATPPQRPPSNVRAEFDPQNNELTFDAYAFDDSVTVQFITDNSAPMRLNPPPQGIVIFGMEDVLKGQYQYSGSNELRNIVFERKRAY